MSNKGFNCHCAHLDELSRDTAENFTAIKESLNSFEDRLDKRLGQMEEWLSDIARNMARLLDMHGVHESAINYNSRMISNHESRIGKLERRAS